MDTSITWADDDKEIEAERAALAGAVAEARADERWVPHEKVRAWLLQVAAGDFTAPPPTPDA